MCHTCFGCPFFCTFIDLNFQIWYYLHYITVIFCELLNYFMLWYWCWLFLACWDIGFILFAYRVACQKRRWWVLCHFLCWICREFLDKVQSEIDRKPDTACSSAGQSALLPVDVGDDVIKHLFQGELISEVSSLYYYWCSQSPTHALTRPSVQ